MKWSQWGCENKPSLWAKKGKVAVENESSVVCAQMMPTNETWTYWWFWLQVMNAATVDWFEKTYFVLMLCLHIVPHILWAIVYTHTTDTQGWGVVCFYHPQPSLQWRDCTVITEMTVCTGRVWLWTYQPGRRQFYKVTLNSCRSGISIIWIFISDVLHLFAAQDDFISYLYSWWHCTSYIYPSLLQCNV